MPVPLHLRSRRFIWHGDAGTDKNIVQVRDVVNAQQKIRLVLLAGQTPVQALLTELRDSGFAHDYETDVEGHLSRAFFASPQSLALFRRYPKVLLLDCT
jgi:hypothetical protein